MTQPDQAEARRKAFGTFLRSRRERLTPGSVGLSDGFRRRTPGLRREEVAQLAGVGTTWYTWLEQGRDVRASAGALSAIAQALQLGPAERRHLFTLADRVPPGTVPAGTEEVPDALVRMLEGMAAQPAYVLGRRWDLLAWNSAAVEVFGDFGLLQGDARNLIYLMFADAGHRRRLLDWEDLAPLSLAMFRADSARHAGDRDFERLISILKRESPEFRLWWPRQEVRHHAPTVKRLRHPTAGLLEFEYLSLDVTGHQGMRLVVCTPAASSPADQSPHESADTDTA